MKKINTDRINIYRMSMKIINILIIIFLITAVNLKLPAQQQILPLGEQFSDNLSFEINRAKTPVNTGFKPFLESDLNKIFDIDSVVYHTDKEKHFFLKHKHTWFYRKLFFEDFISVETENFTLYVNPLFYLETGKVTEIDTAKYFINTRGIEIKGDIGKKLSYYSLFRENQARFRNYIHDWTWNRLVAPGQGAVKKNYNDLSLYDFSSAAGYLSYTPYNWLNIRFGQDKNFIGEGHRSLFLSDNTMNYPFVNFSFNYKKLKYVTMFTQFRDFDHVYYDYHFRKHAAVNFLSYNFINRIELGIFEGVIYQTNDTANYINKFPADYFLPVPGVRTAVNGFGKINHVLTGINLKIKINDFIQTYGQVASDNPKQKKYAVQGGFKIFDAFFSKFKNQQLYLQAEYNVATPHTYSHSNNKFQTWTHYNQELAIPFGGAFSEIYFKANYSYKKFNLNFKYNFVVLNKNRVYSDVYFLDNYEFYTVPEEESLSHKIVNLSYIVNYKTRLQIYAGIDIRNNSVTGKENYIMFGLRTALNNFYYDF